jgi:hypothetical protein
VLDVRGQSLWRWDYAQTNRFITPGGTFGYFAVGAVAIAPSCDAVAIVGHPGYKYTWVATRRGQRTAIRTTSTPMTAAFDRRGENVAIGTAGKDVALYSVAGQLKWKTTLQGCCVVQQLGFSADYRSILIREWGIAVIGLDGQVVWSSSENGMNAARDLRTFVAWSAPPHGPGIGHVVALDESGNRIWSRLASFAHGIVSPAGDKIIAWVDDNQQPTQDQFFSNDEPKASLQVLTRTGSVITTLPIRAFPLQHPRPMAFSGDGNRVLIWTGDTLELIDLQGNSLSKFSAQAGNGTVIVANDFSGVLVASRNRELQIRWYGLD